jgi:4-hydroxybenzoate polyprenyltransferase
MSAPEAARQEAYVLSFVAAVRTAGVVRPRADALSALSWAFLASTLHRIRRGEGALLAVNLSLIAHQAATPARAAIQALVSALTIGVMYALNDLHDAPEDWNNPKKDRALIAAYVERRRPGVLALVVLKLLTLAIAFAALGPTATAAVAGVMIVNVVYSMAFKGVPVVDVAWVWLWGALYAAIVSASVPLLLVVGLMTAVCHLFQALDDRVPDAANGIRTTAVRSPTLARNVLLVLSLLLFAALHAPLGVALALTAFTPLVLFFMIDRAGTGWLLTKAYFAVMWLYLLGVSGAAG